MNAADVMTRDIVTVSSNTSLTDAIQLMLKYRVSGLPVVEDTGELVGLLTEGDLLHRVETGTDAPRMGWLRALATRGHLADDYVHSHGRRVQDVMTRNVTTVKEDSSLADIVRVMESKHFRRVPVVTAERLVGIVSRSDLVRVLGTMLVRQGSPERSDHEIQAGILSEVRQLRWAPGWNVHVTVTDGIVVLDGNIFDDRMRSAMRVIAEGIPGVKEVQDALTLVDPNSLLDFGV